MKTMRLLQGFALSPALSVLALASAAPTHAQTISRFDGCPGVGVLGILNLPTHASSARLPVGDPAHGGNYVLALDVPEYVSSGGDLATLAVALDSYATSTLVVSI